MVAIKRWHDEMIDYDGRVRIETAWNRRNAIATEELLADTVTHPAYQVGGLDSAGKVIVLGQEMQFLDVFAPKVWNVYTFDDASDDPNIIVDMWEDMIDGKPYRWNFNASFSTFEEAEAHALSLV